jgi:hypothetical protein
VIRTLAMVLVLAWSGAALAQTDQDRAQALAMLQAGNDAATDGDWESARVAFARAYALVASTRVLMNLAGAQRHTSHLIDARASYQRWLTDADARDEAYRANVEQALTEIASEIPQLTVSVVGGRPGDTVDLDGHAIVVGQAIEIDPGPHMLELRRGETTVTQQRVTLDLSERRDVSLEAPSLAPRPTPEPVHAAPLVSDHESTELTAQPWFWAAIGGGAAVVIGIIIGIAVAASSSSPAAPDMGTLGPFGI